MKSYEIKLYSRIGDFKKTINPLNVVSEISFSEEINGGQSDMNIEIIGDFNDFLCTDIIEIREVDEENKEISPTYTGIIEEISLKEYENGDTVNLQILGLSTVLNDNIFKSAGNRSFNANATPGNMVKIIIDSFNSDYGTLSGGETQNITGNIIKYTLTSIDTTGPAVNLSFDNDNCLDSIKKALENTDFSFYIGADGICYVQKDSGQSHVNLTLGRQVITVERKIHKRELTNYLFHEREGNNEQIYTDPVSISIFGKKEKKIIESSVLDITTQDEKGGKYIEEFSYERNEIQLVIKPQKTSSIIPGDLLNLNNVKIPLIDKKITKISKGKDSWTIFVGDFISFGETVLNK